MKKLLFRLLSLTLILATLSGLTLRAEESSIYVFDEELDLLTDAEEDALQTLLAQTGARIHGDIVVVLTDYCSDDVEGDAKYFYNSMGFSEDGIIFYCAITDAYWNMSSFGSFHMDEYSLDRLENDCLGLVRAQDYYGAFSTFAGTVEELVLSGTHGDGKDNDAPFPWQRYLLYALIAGFAVAGIVVLVMAGQLKSVHRKSAARDYLKKGSLNVTASRDLFLYRTVSRVAKPKNTSSGGGGSGSGSRSGRI